MKSLLTVLALTLLWSSPIESARDCNLECPEPRVFIDPYNPQPEKQQQEICLNRCQQDNKQEEQMDQQAELMQKQTELLEQQLEEQRSQREEMWPQEDISQ